MNHFDPDDPHGFGARRQGREGEDGRIDEQSLRRLLHDAVDDIEPAEDALEQLRQAVPARRARRRQALGGAVAAAVLMGAAVPAVWQVAATDDGTADHSTNAASSHRHAHETPQGRPDGEDGAGARPGPSAGASRSPQGEQRKDEGGKSSGPSPTSPAGAAVPDPTSSLTAMAPACARSQLGNGSGTVGAADKAGRVYGAFRVVNVSRRSCAVGGPGMVAVHTEGGAAGPRVSVVDHTPGDPAPGLPDPDGEGGQVILQPGQAYEVKFAWVPVADGGPTGCTRDRGATATPSPASSPVGVLPPLSPTPAAKPEASGTPGEVKPPPGLVLTHTPATGEPAVEAQIPDVCAGTVYRTGPLAPTPTV